MCDNEFTIFQYVERELDKDDEAKLINHLADCGECKKILSDYVELKNKTNTFYKIVKQDSIATVAKEANETKFTFRRIVAYSAAAAVIIIGFLLITIPTKEKPFSITEKPRKITELQLDKANENITQIKNKVEKKPQKKHLKSKNIKESSRLYLDDQSWLSETNEIMFMISSMETEFEEKPL